MYQVHQNLSMQYFSTVFSSFILKYVRHFKMAATSAILNLRIGSEAKSNWYDLCDISAKFHAFTTFWTIFSQIDWTNNTTKYNPTLTVLTHLILKGEINAVRKVVLFLNRKMQKSPNDIYVDRWLHAYWLYFNLIAFIFRYLFDIIDIIWYP